MLDTILQPTATKVITPSEPVLAYLKVLEKRGVEYLLIDPDAFKFTLEEPQRVIRIDTRSTVHRWRNELNRATHPKITAENFEGAFGIGRSRDKKLDMKATLLKNVVDRGLHVVDSPGTTHFWIFSAQKPGDAGTWVQAFAGDSFWRWYNVSNPELTLRELEAMAKPSRGPDFLGLKGSLKANWFNKPADPVVTTPDADLDPYDALKYDVVSPEHVVPAREVTARLRREPFTRALLGHYSNSYTEENVAGYSTAKIGETAYLIMQELPDGRRYPTAIYQLKGLAHIRELSNWDRTNRIPETLAPMDGESQPDDLYVPLEYLATELGHSAGSRFVKDATALGIGVRTNGTRRSLMSVVLRDIPKLAAQMLLAKKGKMHTVEEVQEAALAVAKPQYRPLEERVRHIFAEAPVEPEAPRFDAEEDARNAARDAELDRYADPVDHGSAYDDPDPDRPAGTEPRPTPLVTTGSTNALDPLPTQTTPMSQTPETPRERAARLRAELAAAEAEVAAGADDRRIELNSLLEAGYDRRNALAQDMHELNETIAGHEAELDELRTLMGD